MSIRINNKIISGTYTAQSYRYVGEIFQSALPIEDSRVALLDGHKIYESEGYGSFIQYITSLALLYPQLACTEAEWQTINTTYGECGKFVIDEDGVRLPKIVSFVQGLSSLQDLATLVEAGLPNLTGTIGKILHYGSAGHNGVFSITAQGNNESLNSASSKWGGSDLSFDASDSNPIYGNSTTVQPQSIRYPYYIVLATGVTQEVKVKEELTTNIPFTLFESKYSEVELNNTSWLLSSGQWNSKGLYPSAYNELVKEYNAGSNKYSIKLHTEEYGDYDFVLNLNDETFRLPLKTKFSPVRENSSVVGNGMPLGLFGSVEGALGIANNGGLYGRTQYLGANVGQTVSGATTISSGNNDAVGVTTDPTKSGIELYNDISDLYLYFYVGDTNINVSLVDTGKLTQEVANLIPNNSDLISGYSMPSDRYVDLELGASGTTYTAPANGWFLVSKNINSGQYIKIYNLPANSAKVMIGACASSSFANFNQVIGVPVKKGDRAQVTYTASGTTNWLRFVYAEGEK